MGQQYVPARPYPELHPEHAFEFSEVQIEHPVVQAEVKAQFLTDCVANVADGEVAAAARGLARVGCLLDKRRRVRAAEGRG